MGLLEAAVIGAACGLRTFSGPATLAAGGQLGDGWVQKATIVAAAGELVGDKLPLTPPRTDAPSLAARIASGAFCGYRLGGPVGAGLGAIAAVGSAFAGMQTRRQVGHALKLPDIVVAAGEDAVTYGLARIAVHQ
jgi:uncharacterized membrane protein